MTRLRRAMITLVLCAPGLAGAEPGAPAVSVIIDDIGWRLREGLLALELPGAVVLSILPHTPHGKRLGAEAARRGKEVLLHQPLEAVSNNGMLGPGALDTRMSREEFAATLAGNLRAVPWAIGINNHMGSLLTRDPERMGWLMAGLRTHGGLVFVDSRTTGGSVAGRMARERSVPTMDRDVFLDNVVDPDYVLAQIELLADTARRKGTAIAIGHPHAVTLEVLAAALPRLAERGVELVGLFELLRRREVYEAEPRLIEAAWRRGRPGAPPPPP